MFGAVRLRLRFWLALAPFAVIAVCANVVVLSGVHAARHRAAVKAASLSVPASDAPQPVVLGDGKAPQPDTADYTTIMLERDALARTATMLLTTIKACEATPDPYGTGLPVLNECLSVPVRQNIMRARVEPQMVLGALRHMREGRCMELTSGLIGAVSELGGASYAWSGDVEDPGASPGPQERKDVKDLRMIAGGIIALTHARGWRTACTPRSYDSAEHQGPGHAAPARVNTSQLVL